MVMNNKFLSVLNQSGAANELKNKNVWSVNFESQKTHIVYCK